MRYSNMLLWLVTGIGLSVLSLGVCGRSARADWRLDANARIETHRKAELTVRVTDAAGRPVRDANVRIRQTRHAFGIGTAVNGKCFTGRERASEDVRRYRAAILAHFNRAVMESGHKWKQWADPNRRALTIETTEWLLSHGLEVRGHTMIWQREKSVPPEQRRKINRLLAAGSDEADAAASADSDAAGPADSDADRPAGSAGDTSPDPNEVKRLRREVLDASLAHIAEIGRHEYAHGCLIEWDVVNEPLHQQFIRKALTPDAPTTAQPLMVQWLKAARKAAPRAKLYINDYAILNRGSGGNRRRYIELIDYLRANGAPLDGVGFQCHIGNGRHAPSGEQMVATFDRFAAKGLDLLITEFDMWGGGWGDPNRKTPTKAEFARDVYTAAFSHPRVKGLLMWGFWDGAHWRNSAPLYTRDWQLKPEGEVFRELFYDRWWTRGEWRTGDEGLVRQRCFLGDYAITVSQGGRTVRAAVSVPRDGASVDVPLTD